MNCFSLTLKSIVSKVSCQSPHLSSRRTDLREDLVNGDGLFSSMSGSSSNVSSSMENVLSLNAASLRNLWKQENQLQAVILNMYK